MPTPKSHLDLYRNYILRALQPLQVWAIRPQAERDLEHVFGTNINWALAFKLLSAFRDGDYSSLPPVSILPPCSMPGLWGGYSRDARAIYISADCPNEMLSAVLIEEIGHFLDQELCTEETPGEEGALFAALVIGLPLETASSDDSLASVFLEGRHILVEAARKSRGSSKGKSSGKSSGKKRGSRTFDNGSGYAVAGSGSVNSRPQDNIVYATQDDTRIPQIGPGDRVIGSQGNDTFVVNSQDVQIEDSSGTTDTVESPITFSLAKYSSIENLVLTGSANISGTGNFKANFITGNSGNNLLDGGIDSAIDTLKGGAGDDTYVLRDTLDQVVEGVGQGNDVILTDLSSLSLLPYANIEQLAYMGSLTGGVTYTGNSANNLIYGSAGPDALNGEAGTDSMVGGAGNDTYFVNTSADAVFEAQNQGDDLIVSTAEKYTLSKYIETLLLDGTADIHGTGNSGDNSIYGNSGKNSLDGGGGGDTLQGGGGADTYIGGGGNDFFIVKNQVSIVEDADSVKGGIDTVITHINSTLHGGVENMAMALVIEPSGTSTEGTEGDVANNSSTTGQIFTGSPLVSEID